MAGASVGMTIVEGMPSSFAAYAIACAWLPELQHYGETADTVTVAPFAPEGDHAVRALLGRELAQRVDGATKLEGSTALQVLCLEEDCRARQRIGLQRRQHRRFVRILGHALRCRLHVVE
jgi:hypothetical protein